MMADKATKPKFDAPDINLDQELEKLINQNCSAKFIPTIVCYHCFGLSLKEQIEKCVMTQTSPDECSCGLRKRKLDQYLRDDDLPDIM